LTGDEEIRETTDDDTVTSPPAAAARREEAVSVDAFDNIVCGVVIGRALLPQLAELAKCVFDFAI